MYAIVEKRNRIAVYGVFPTKEQAAHHFTHTLPEYLERGIFLDETLTIDSFEVIEYHAEPGHHHIICEVFEGDL